MAQRSRFQRFKRRFRPAFQRVQRSYSNYRQRRRNRNRSTKPNFMQKYLKYILLAAAIFLIYKNKQKILDFFKKITGKTA